MRLNTNTLMRLYIAFNLAMDANVFLQLFGNITPSTSRGGIVNNPIMFGFTGLLVGGSVVLLIPVFKRSSRVLLNNPWLFSLYLWDTLSLFWSKTPSNVVRGMATVWAYLLCGLIVSYYLTALEISKTIVQTTLVLGVISIFFQVFFPVRGTAAPGWTGIYGEKNHLGLGMSIGIVCLLVSTKKWGIWPLAQLLIFLVLLAGSQSATSMGVAAVAFTAFVYIRMRPHFRPLAIVLAAGSLILVGLFVPNIVEKGFQVAGKNTNFTGRDVIWALTLQYWKEQPILGYGAYSFWETEDVGIVSALHWNPREAHNGYLEVLVTDGAIGFALLVGILASGYFLARRTWRTHDLTAALFLTLIFVALVVEDLTESDFMVPGLLWFTFGLAYFAGYAAYSRHLPVSGASQVRLQQEVLV